MARTVIWLFVLTPLLYLLFVLGARQLPPTAEQRQALALLEVPTPPVAGRDGTNAAWLLGRDVPVARHAEIGPRYRAWLDQQLHQPSAAPDPRASFASLPRVPSNGQGVEPGCLAYARENRDSVASALAAHRARLAASLALADYDGLRYGVEPSWSQEMPDFLGMSRLVRTHLAREFNEGRQLEAIAATCRDIAGWRRLGADTDYLIASMVGVGSVRQDLVLLAEMLAELPAATALPSECGPALAAGGDRELSTCAAMRTEFRGLQDVQAILSDRHQDEDSILRQRWLVDPNNFRAALAPALSPYCEPRFLQAARADRSVSSLWSPPRACSAWRKVADPIGCILAEVAMPTFARYTDRRTDQAAMLALMRARLWLRSAGVSEAGVPEALRRLPPALGLRRTPTFDPETRRIAIPLLDTSRGMYFELPVQLRVTATPPPEPMVGVRSDTD